MIQLLEKMTVNPAKLYPLPYGTIQEGAESDFVIFDPGETWIPKEYASKFIKLTIYRRGTYR